MRRTHWSSEAPRNPSHEVDFLHTQVAILRGASRVRARIKVLAPARAQALAGLDAIGMVVDFSVLKSFYGDWIDRNWDHGFLLWDKDTEAIAAVNACKGAGGCAQKALPHAAQSHRREHRGVYAA